MVRKIFGQIYIWLILIFMYLPILVLIAFSFTKAVYVGQWTGFTFDLYRDLFASQDIMIALGNTLILAFSSAIVSTILGTTGVVGAYYLKKKYRKTFDTVTQIPIVNAEIVMALSLLVMVVFIDSLFFNGQGSLKGFWTLLIGHTVLSVPFVYTSVKPKLQQMDPSLYEAALDLGCTPNKAMRKIMLPEIMPGILGGFLLAVTLSLDDFIITAFLTGPGLFSEGDISTLSTYIQSIIKKRPVPPELRALTTIISILVVLAVIGISVYRSYQLKHKKTHAQARRGI
ncbi:MAG: ABC transporter permease [Erysipelotrichaceae bacterium]|nr:ABC transporter permease [Erysipelotrichaceae bacterium]